MNLSDVKFNCRHFKGDIPCKPNKLRGKICECDEYDPVTKRILIIKLAAIGDVIRTTPLLERFRKEYPGCQITWITNTPDILPANHIDEIYPFDFKSTYILRHREFDLATNLDKDWEACALLNDVKAEEKYGFNLENGHISAATNAATHKLITGLFDEYSQANTKSYLEEIFEILHMDFKGEDYVLERDQESFDKWESIREQAEGKPIIGLNTGCGHRWTTRLWPADYWISLIQQLQQDGYYPLILGGPEEDEQNQHYTQLTGAYYPGIYPLQEFIAITDHCDVIVSAVSMMMHIAIGLKKPLILFNNIFNSYEYELYGRGEIIEPPTGCDDFYGQYCTRERHCMKDIPVETVYQAIERHLPYD